MVRNLGVDEKSVLMPDKTNQNVSPFVHHVNFTIIGASFIIARSTHCDTMMKGTAGTKRKQNANLSLRITLVIS